jgi:hypothetical protein
MGECAHSSAIKAKNFHGAALLFRHIFTQDSTIRSVKSSVMNVLIQVKNRCRRRQHHDD